MALARLPRAARCPRRAHPPPPATRGLCGPQLAERAVAHGLTGTAPGDLLARRRDVMRRLPEGAALVVAAATEHPFAHDIPFPFRQAPDFAYLTDFHEPDAVAVLRAGGDELVMFVAAKDPQAELWNGPRTGVDGAVADFGATQAFALSSLAEELPRAVAGAAHVCAPLALAAAHPVRAALPGLDASASAVEEARHVKSAAEQERLRKVGLLGARGVRHAMQRTREGMFEHQAAVDYEHFVRRRGAERLAYPVVSAAGANACTLHYQHGRAPLHRGDLLLVDAGCELRGLCSDVTRTWPVGERFSPAQRAVYEAVLDVQRQCLRWVQEHASDGDLLQLHTYAMMLVQANLQQLGIRSARGAAQRYMPHGTGHWLGMDTHDTPSVPMHTPLQPGVAFTVEPGIYIPPDDAAAPPELRGIGVRIEDDVMITEGGLVEVLTPESECPKAVEEVEELALSK